MVGLDALPAAIDAERTILGAILLDNAAHSEAAEKLSADDFSLDSHKRIYLRMSDLIDEQRSVDIVTLSNELRRLKEIESVGGVAYLASLTEGLPRRPVIEEYVRLVKEKAILRKLMQIASLTLARALDQTDSPLEIAADMNTQTDLVIEKGLDVRRNSSDIAQATISALDEFERRRNATGDDTLSYGLVAKFDALTGGMSCGEVTTVGGPPGIGKSTVAIQALVEAGRKGLPGVCFSLEMTKEQILGRMWSIVSGVPYRHVRFPHTATPDQVARLRAAAVAISEWPLDIYDRASMTLGEILGAIKIHIHRRNARLITVDYLQRIIVPGQREVRLQMSEAAMKLAMAVKKTPAHLLLLSQLRRSEDNGLPQMKHLRESGQIEAEAHTIALLWREFDVENGYYLTNAKILVPKSRFGFTGVVDATFNIDLATYEAA